jgi:8-oxo-dGTP diphosphatase
MKKQATMIYLTRGDEILFLERRKENDKVHKQGMHIPMGGKVEKGEPIEDCIKREALEESGIKVNSVDLRGVIYFREF